ncbi:uncharacterized protein [Venturia canescens]|uniref:uncharacterized protein n=1 Tax=Venturia canescens TaxID=32260 RepID=UPI001C9CBACB|nr:uncharacterized protein LOC122408102 [Venturia canescens]
MRTQILDVCDQLSDFSTGFVNWSWDTLDLLFEIFVEFLARTIELGVALLKLSFQIICFLRDVCIEAMQTFVNIFRGIVHVISSIKCEDVEDFAAACMVVFLWVAGVKIVLSLLQNNKKPFSNPLNFYRAAASCAPAVLQKVGQPAANSTTKKKVMIQSKKAAGCKRPASSSISSSSSFSYDA